jgi:Flp pilus assembly protein TadD
VPLLVRLPQVTRPAQAVHEDVGLIDIQPTILDYLDIGRPAGTEGSSLLGVLGGRPAPSRPLYFETEAGTNVFGWAPIDGLRIDGWKLIRCTRSELYNVAEDPQEQVDLQAAHPEVVTRLASLLDETRASTSQLAADIHDAARLSLSDETREQLAALGYLSGSADEIEEPEAELIHPRDHIWVINEWSRLRDDVASERLSSAESRLRYLTAYDPSNPDFKNIQGMIYAKTGRELEAEQVWEELLSRGFDRVNILQNLGQLMHRTGRPDRALELYRLAVDKAASEPDVKGWLLVRVAEILKERGDSSAALEALAELAELRPRDPEVLRRQAAIHYHAGNAEQAEALLERSLTVNPYYSRSYQNLAALYIDLGAVDQALDNARRCVELAPEYPEGRYILAVALAENGDREAAVRILRELTGEISMGSLVDRARLLLATLDEQGSTVPRTSD